MFLKDDYGMNIILLDEENLIYKRTLGKITIKRSDIRSVFYDESILGVLTYSGRIYSLNIIKLLYSEREKLEYLREELNRENILFDYINHRGSMSTIAFILLIPILINLDSVINQIISVVLIFFVFFYIIIYKRRLMTKIVFNIDKKEFEVLRGKHTYKYKKKRIDKIRVIRSTDLNTIEFKKNGNKYRMFFKETPYLIKIYNLSLAKLFN